MSVVDRISLIISNEQLSVRAFDKSICKKGGYTSSLIAREGTPSADVIAEIHKVYPQYNLTWLLTGDGEWLNEDSDENTRIEKTTPKDKKTTSITINLTEGDENSELFKALERLLNKEMKK